MHHCYVPGFIHAFYNDDVFGLNTQEFDIPGPHVIIFISMLCSCIPNCPLLLIPIKQWRLNLNIFTEGLLTQYYNRKWKRKVYICFVHQILKWLISASPSESETPWVNPNPLYTEREWSLFSFSYSLSILFVENTAILRRRPAACKVQAEWSESLCRYYSLIQRAKDRCRKGKIDILD